MTMAMLPHMFCHLFKYIFISISLYYKMGL